MTNTAATARAAKGDSAHNKDLALATLGVEIAQQSRAKRVLDVALAMTGIILSMPLGLLVALAIKLGDRGPVLYQQHRYGLGGTTFRLLKFRTMHHELGSEGIHGAKENDDRITRVGKVLRATGMDELPQLWSILVGDMSFVGPRALAVGEAIRMSDGSYVEFENIPGFRQRLRVAPGLTGPATIFLSKDADPMAKLEYDLAYIREGSFGGDLRLIALSLWISLRGKWETRGSKL